MSNQRKFIKKVFELIKNSFEEFTNENISLIIRNHTKIKPHEGDVIKLEYISQRDHVNYFIYMVDDCYRFLDNRPKFHQSLCFENREFLESLGIMAQNDIFIPEDAIVIDFLLHEFGHISHMKRFLNISTLHEVINLRNINDQSIALFLNSKECKDVYMRQYFLFGEDYAEMFKFQHFYKIWKLLQ